MEQAIRHVRPANVREDQHQVFGANKAGGQMPAALLNVLHEILRSQLGLLALDQLECQGQDVAGLRVPLDVPILAHVGAVERRTDSLEHPLKRLGLSNLAEHSRSEE